MTIFQYKSYGNELSPEKLVVFIHGYKSSMDDVTDNAKQLSMLLPDTVIVTPQATNEYKNNKLHYWYNVSLQDVKHIRRLPETPVDEIVDIYNQGGELLSVQAKAMNLFIDEIQKLYKVENTQTYIAGFSQGAMMAIYTALSRAKKVGGCFAFSGIVAGKDKLAEELASKPEVYMFHGKDDLSVQYKTLDFSVDWLIKHHINIQDYRYDNLSHEVVGDELIKMAEIIKAK